MARVIVISAHPDDEILGCGGTLLKHRQSGDEIYWLIITSVLESHGFTKERVNSRQEEIRKVAQGLVVSKIFQLGYPTMSLDSSSVNKMIPQISEVFNEVKPETIYVMNRSDAHSDHRIIFDAVAACTKSFRYPFLKKVLMYECLSETEFAPMLLEKVFMPNYFVDISSYMAKKLELMKIYKSELGEHPFPRSLRNIEAIAVYRGATSGVEYAEAFQLIKYIDK